MHGTPGFASRSEWIAFCDDDDVWAPQKLGRQWAAAQSDDSVDFLVGSIIIATETGRFHAARVASPSR